MVETKTETRVIIDRAQLLIFRSSLIMLVKACDMVRSALMMVVREIEKQNGLKPYDTRTGETDTIAGVSSYS